jgi:hypothetical protein
MSSRNSIFVSKLLIEDLSSTDHLDAGVSTGRLFFLGPAHEPTVCGPMGIHGLLLYGTLIVEDH